MSRFVIFAFLVVAGVAVIAAPAEEYETLALVDEAYADETDHLRFRRVTCDLLSFGGKVGDSACAANCLSMGKAGGSCSGGVCRCRKDSFKDLWDKRFG